MEMFETIISAFDFMSGQRTQWSRGSIVDATALSKAMLNFDLIITLHCWAVHVLHWESD